MLAANRTFFDAIGYELDGVVLDANERFLEALGYGLDEIKGRHHAMFVDQATRESADYATFWERLKRGEFQAGEYRRAGKHGREVWIQATYNPILDAGARP